MFQNSHQPNRSRIMLQNSLEEMLKAAIRKVKNEKNIVNHRTQKQHSNMKAPFSAKLER